MRLTAEQIPRIVREVEALEHGAVRVIVRADSAAVDLVIERRVRVEARPADRRR